MLLISGHYFFTSVLWCMYLDLVIKNTQMREVTQRRFQVLEAVDACSLQQNIPPKSLFQWFDRSWVVCVSKCKIAAGGRGGGGRRGGGGAGGGEGGGWASLNFKSPPPPLPPPPPPFVGTVNEIAFQISILFPLLFL